MTKTIITNAKLLRADGTVQSEAYVVIDSGIITSIGSTVPKESLLTHCDEIIDAKGRLLTPALIDCHTHVVYAGNRANEYERRLEGVSYSQIAREGGGIQSTVQATRSASFNQLYDESYPRVSAMKELGVGTLEVKSGYGLDFETEIKMLKVAKKLGKDLNLRVKTTFLGAHALPNEYKDKADDYIELVCSMLPTIKEQQLADSVDVFCESIGFSLEQTERVFLAAKELGLDLKCHAEQLSNLGASELAASFSAKSCDHLEYTDPKAISAMAKANTVGVLLPGAFYFLREKKRPLIEEFRRKGVELAIATDSNPGSSPTYSLPLMMNMATVLFSMTVKETWQAVTKHAAKALALEGEVGAIEVGKRAELVIWDCDNLAAMCYGFGQIKPHRRIG